MSTPINQRRWAIYCATDGSVCKVGVTYAAAGRLEALRAHSGIPVLRIEREWPLDGGLSGLDVLRIERAIHSALRRSVPPPRFGEWYLAQPDVVTSAIDGHLADTLARVSAARGLVRVPVWRRMKATA